MTNGDLVFRVGNQKEADAFALRNRHFLERLAPVVALAKSVFVRTLEVEPVDRVIFTSGELAMDNFWEILLLAANGYGFGARGILRTMFERVVVARHLADHPDEVDQFLDYFWVVKWKHMNAVTTTLGDVFPSEVVADTKAHRDAVIGRCPSTDCTKCGQKGPVLSWTKKDMVSMAKEAGLGIMVVPCYYEPTQQVHDSVHALMNHMKIEEDGASIGYAESQPDIIDTAVRNAHQLLMVALAVQINHFKFESLEADLAACQKTFIESWGLKAPEMPQSGFTDPGAS